MILRDYDFGLSEDLGQMSEVAGRLGGGRIQESNRQEDGNGLERR